MKWLLLCRTHDGCISVPLASYYHPTLDQVTYKYIHNTHSLSHLVIYIFIDGAVYTQALILIQVAFFGALHRMLKGAYNSGPVTYNSVSSLNTIIMLDQINE